MKSSDQRKDQPKTAEDYYRICEVYALNQPKWRQWAGDFAVWAYLATARFTREFDTSNLFTDWLRVTGPVTRSGLNREHIYNSIEYSEYAKDIHFEQKPKFDFEPYYRSLKGDERVIFRMYFEYGYLQKEIGKKFGITEARITQRLNDICKKLKKRLKRPVDLLDSRKKKQVKIYSNNRKKDLGISRELAAMGIFYKHPDWKKRYRMLYAERYRKRDKEGDKRRSRANYLKSKATPGHRAKRAAEARRYRHRAMKLGKDIYKKAYYKRKAKDPEKLRALWRASYLKKKLKKQSI